MATQAKGVAHLLTDWVEYHRRIGVDMVYILDNNDESDLWRLMRPRADVEVVYWPWQKSQVQAFSYLLVVLRTRCKWVLMTDVDEYVMLGLGDQLQLAAQEPFRLRVRAQYLKQFKSVFLPFVIMGPSGNIRRPNKPLPEAYTYLNVLQNANGKVLVRTDHDWVFSVIHLTIGRSFTKVYRNSSWDKYPVDKDDAMSLVHFQKRSLEETIAKKLGGSASTTDRKGLRQKDTMLNMERPPSYFVRKRTEFRFTHFRKLWLAVMRVGEDDEQTLVREKKDSSCERRYNVKIGVMVGDEICRPLEEPVNDDTKL